MRAEREGRSFMLNTTPAAPARITALRFVAADPSRRGRRVVPHRRRRRLVGGVELEGNLHTLGYFSAEVCVGTPPKSFDLIVDTGSALTALPCADCTKCGVHKHATSSLARYDQKLSATSRRVDCEHPPPGLRCSSSRQKSR